MGIDVLKRLGKNAVQGQLGKNLRRIAGNVGSLIRGDGGADSSDFAGINETHISFIVDLKRDEAVLLSERRIFVEVVTIFL